MVPPETQDRWLPYRRSSAHARRRVFCLPHAGGAASLFRDWRAILADEIELCPIQLPGRETRIAEPPHTRLSDLVPAIVEGIRDDLDLPFALFGHSNGALIAFEIAGQLRRERLPLPSILVVSAHRAPHLPDPVPPRHRLSDDELLAELKRLAGTPAVLLDHPEMMRFFLSVYRADLELGETRNTGPVDPFPFPIAAYGGGGDPDVSPEDLDAWDRHTLGHFRRRLFGGGHFYLKTSAPDVLSSLVSDLTEASSPARLRLLA